MNRVYVLLGSNIDKERNLPAAVALLRRHGPIRVSAAYETLPVGTEHREPFLNAAVELATWLAPPAFKHAICGGVERALGRVRVAGDKSAPRTIDVDIALWNEDVLDVLGSAVPDPDVLRCLHVALPLVDLAPELRHPTDGRTLQEIAQELAARMAPEHFPRRRSDVILLP